MNIVLNWFVDHYQILLNMLLPKNTYKTIISISCSFIVLIALNSCSQNQESVKDDVVDIYQPDTTFKIVGYLNSNSFDRFDSIDISPLTYLNLAFASPDSAGNLIFRGNKSIKHIVKKAHSLDIKVFVSLAGGGTVYPDIWNKVCSDSMRPLFIKNILKYVNENNLDGVDVDIEWNLLPYMGSLYTSFVLDLRTALHAEGKGISTALAAVNVDAEATDESLQAYDFINVMVYDKYLTAPGSHSPYSYALEAHEYWVNQRNIPEKKLVMGMPFYGYDFVAKKHQLYRNIVKENPENAQIDSIGTLFYNGIPTIVEKTKLAKNSFNGVMFWELTQDTQGELSLLKNVEKTLKTLE